MPRLIRLRGFSETQEVSYANLPSAFSEWLATTNGSIALHESLYVYPLVESVHVLTLCLFVGTAIMLDLRLMGLTLQDMKVSEVLAQLSPWLAGGFVIMVITGALLFYAIPVRSFHSVFFRAKLAMLFLAGVNAWVFHRTTQRRVAQWDLEPVPPRGARLAGALSLVLWAGIIIAGRMIAYDWFDCDRPQPSIVVWAAGCPARPQE
jgi:hypothetical protein